MLTEDQETEAELKAMFPEFNDFADMTPGSLEPQQAPASREEDATADGASGELPATASRWPTSKEEALVVQGLHADVFKAVSLPWLRGVHEKRSDKADALWLEAHVERFVVFKASCSIFFFFFFFFS